ncbi:galactosylceramide sulfotransferase-like [Saccoglossus kowalevskii]
MNDQENTAFRNYTDVNNEKDTCNPQQQIVFIKTHKTASSSTATIIQRYGYTRGLLYAIPKSFYKTHLFSTTKLFNVDMVYKYSKSKSFNIIAGHLRHNHNELEKLVHGAKFVTILREPVAKFESTFGYYEVAKHLNLDKYANPLQEFMSNPDSYYNENKFLMKEQLRNGMAFSLGLPQNIYKNNTQYIQQNIHRLDAELDLVLLSEYYDESLLLLKKSFCWQWHDILYIRKGQRSSSHRHIITSSMVTRIQEWNIVDVMLYDHFNRTFWRKISEYGPHFQNDLAEFRKRQGQFYDDCVSSSMSYSDRRAVNPTMKRGASKYCEVTFYSSSKFTFKFFVQQTLGFFHI